MSPACSQRYGEVGAIADRSGFAASRQEVILIPQHLVANCPTGCRWSDRSNAFEIIAGAIDEVVALSSWKSAAARVAVDAVEHRHAVGEGTGFAPQRSRCR